MSMIVARAIREEIVRQYRDDDRSKCPAGLHFWEQEIQPYLVASAAIEAIREPTAAMIEAGTKARWQSAVRDADSVREIWRAMIEEMLRAPA